MIPTQSEFPQPLSLLQHQQQQQPLNFTIPQHHPPQFIPLTAAPARGEPAFFHGDYENSIHTTNHPPVVGVSSYPMIPSMSASVPTYNTHSLSNAYGNSSGISVVTGATPAVPQPSPRIGTYFKARGPDDEALEMAILLSHQESAYGVNMFDSLRAEDEVTVNAYMALGYTENDAILEIFERRFGLSPLFNPQVRKPFKLRYVVINLKQASFAPLAYNANVNSFTYPGRGNQG
jgi:hypothetical protein